jgi:cysteinyl-tRNA synthetase, unknown class
MKPNPFLFLLPFLIITACTKKNLDGINFRSEMVKFVGEISTYSKTKQPGFIIVPQNGEALASETGFLASVDAIGIEDLSFGYNADGVPTPADIKSERLTYLNMFKAVNKPVLVTDYVFSNSEDIPLFDAAAKNRIDIAYQFNINNGFIPYATVRNLNWLTINPGHEPAVDELSAFTDSKSFLYYLQPDNISKTGYIDSISRTDFDIVIMDLTYDGLDEYTTAEISKIKNGLNNGKGGYVLCYMSIGEAEDYRYYFKKEWITPNLFDPGHTVTGKAPIWLDSENEDWPGNFKVLYWDQNWKNIIFGNSESYLDKIISKGFDGVYLDIIDAYEYFEEKVNN